MQTPAVKRPFASRPPIQRIQWLDEQLRGQRYPSAARAIAEFEISRRTFCRDLDYLRLMLGAPVGYDRHRGGYYYTDDTFSLAAVHLTEGELLALFVAERVMRQYAGTPYGKGLQSAFEKICSSLTSSITVDLTYHDPGFTFDLGPLRAPDLDIFDTVCRSLQNRTALRIQYHTQSRDCDTERVVEPYHLHNHKGDWYLIALCHRRRQIRNFLLSRVVAAELAHDRFTMPEDFAVESYIRESFGIEKSGRPMNVAIWFDSYQARWIREREWHPTQRIDDHDDGSLTLHFKATGLDEVARWVLSYGEHALVLKPAKLKRRVAAAVAQAARNYERDQ